MLARATSMIVDDDDDGDARSAIARDGNGFAVEFVEREERGETTFEGGSRRVREPGARGAATRRGAMRASEVNRVEETRTRDVS